MSLQLMKERIKCTGITPREEMIRDGQNILKEELEHDSSYSPTVYFYNPELKKDVRPAKLRIHNRKFSSLNGNYQNFLTTFDNPVKIGEYIHDKKDDTYWLVYNSFDVNGIHYEGKMIQCNYLLRWQIPNGKIIERWANIVSASKYDVGEKGNSTIILSTNNYTVLIGYCEEGFELEGKRVFIDMKPTNPTKVFKITRSDDVIYNSSEMGYILSFIADKTEFNKDTDNQELRICDYIEPSTSLPPQPSLPDETTDLSAICQGNISCKGNKSIIAGGNAKIFSFTPTDKYGNQIAYTNFTWDLSVDDRFKKCVSATISEDNKCRIKVSYDNLIIGEHLKLIVKDENNIEITSIIIEIRGGL